MTKVILPETGEAIFLGSTSELESDLKNWREADCSEHEFTEWRRLITSSGGIQIRRQCRRCGYLLGNPRRREAGDEQLPEADRTARDAFEAARTSEYERILQKHARLQRDQENSWFRAHNEYLTSDAWQRKRKLVFQRSGGRCEGCGVNAATQVHHLSYDHWQAEFLFELAAVCEECHNRLHERLGSHGDDRK